MVDSKENYKFDLRVKGLIEEIQFVQYSLERDEGKYWVYSLSELF